MLEEVFVNGNINGNGRKKRRKRIIYVSVGVALVLVIAGGLIAATSGSTKIDPSKLAKVEKGDLAKSVVATGKVTPITKVEVKSKASGIVKKLFVDAGDKVKKRQLLAQLDKEEIQAQVEQSRAGLQAAEASMKGAEADFERAKVDAEGPDVPLLKRAYERAVGMAKEGVVSTSALEDAQKAYELALNKQNVAKAQVVVLRAKTAQAEAQVAQDRANLKQLEEQFKVTPPAEPLRLSWAQDLLDRAVISLSAFSGLATAGRWPWNMSCSHGFSFSAVLLRADHSQFGCFPE